MNSDFKFSDHIDSYPPVIPRAKVGKYFPWLSQKRLANLDNLGQGPERSFRNGRAVLYPTWAFLQWLDERTQPKREDRKNPILAVLKKMRSPLGLSVEGEKQRHRKFKSGGDKDGSPATFAVRSSAVSSLLYR